jgi:recombination protein RecT
MAVTDVANPRKTLKQLLSEDAVKQRYNDMLGKKAAGFMTSIINVVNQNKQLQECEPGLILGSAAIAASMDLPIDPNLGFSYIVPYKEKGVPKPQFQMGWKGFVQLGMRSGQYKTMNVCEVYEGEIAKHNRFTGDIEFDSNAKKSDEIIGYVAYFKLINGYEKYLYMTVPEIQAHAKKYSQGYGQQWSQWSKNFHAMAMKTVVKRLLSKWGILSIDMQMALKADQAHVKEGENGEYEFEYVDGTSAPADEPEMRNITPSANADLNSRLNADLPGMAP